MKYDYSFLFKPFSLFWADYIFALVVLSTSVPMALTNTLLRAGLVTEGNPVNAFIFSYTLNNTILLWVVYAVELLIVVGAYSFMRYVYFKFGEVDKYWRRGFYTYLVVTGLFLVYDAVHDVAVFYMISRAIFGV